MTLNDLGAVASIIAAIAACATIGWLIRDDSVSRRQLVGARWAMDRYASMSVPTAQGGSQAVELFDLTNIGLSTAHIVWLTFAHANYYADEKHRMRWHLPGGQSISIGLTDVDLDKGWIGIAWRDNADYWSTWVSWFPLSEHGSASKQWLEAGFRTRARNNRRRWQFWRRLSNHVEGEQVGPGHLLLRRLPPRTSDEQLAAIVDPIWAGTVHINGGSPF